MPEAAFTLSAAIKIDGSPLADNLIPLVEHVTVDDYLHLPDMFVLTFRDISHDVLSQTKLKIGSKVRIEGTALGEPKPGLLIAGEVTSIEAEYGPAGNRAIVRGYDPSHRLHRGRHTATFRKMKDSDIARKLAQAAGLTIGTIDDTGQVFDHVSQANVTDWEFLSARAQEIGFEVAVDDGKFHFRKPTQSSEGPGGGDFSDEEPTKLVMNKQLLEFLPRVTSAGQVKEVEVRGWDPKTKKALVGKAPAKTTSAKLKATPAALAGDFGNPVHVTVDRPMSSQRAVDDAAKAISETVASAFAEAEGVAIGNPKLKSGTPVSVSVVGPDFEGQYTLTQTRHDFDARGYRTRFIVSGRHERSLLGLTSNGTGGGSGGGGKSIDGVVVAIVTNNDDPDKLARVKLKFPWLADDYESDWARMTQTGAGPDSGAVFLPEVGDEVLVAFEFGDMRRPYVVGGLYNGVDKPRLGDKPLVQGGKVKRRGFISRKGHRAIFLDDQSKSGVAILTGDSKLRIALKETGTEIHVHSDGTIKIDATSDITIKSSAGVSIEANGQLSLKGQGGVKIQSGAVVDIDGSMIQLN
jgi:phage protein D